MTLTRSDLGVSSKMFALPQDNFEYGVAALMAVFMLVAIGGKNLRRNILELVSRARMTREERRWRKRVIATNFGRDCGWYVELDGRRVAMLTDQEFVEMFWDSCALTPLVDDAAERERMTSDRFWWHQSGLKFRNREFDVYCEYAFAAGDPLFDPGRVSMRGLYIHVVPHMTLWEEFWARRTQMRNQKQRYRETSK